MGAPGQATQVRVDELGRKLADSNKKTKFVVNDNRPRPAKNHGVRATHSKRPVQQADPTHGKKRNYEREALPQADPAWKDFVKNVGAHDEAMRLERVAARAAPAARDEQLLIEFDDDADKVEKEAGNAMIKENFVQTDLVDGVRTKIHREVTLLDSNADPVESLAAGMAGIDPYEYDGPAHEQDALAAYEPLQPETAATMAEPQTEEEDFLIKF